MIYEIVCNITNERYIGSTFETTLSKRINYHIVDSKKNKETGFCSSKNIINRNNYNYDVLEIINTTSRIELRQAERLWYDKLPNINKKKPYSNEQEKIEYKNNWYQDNKERISEKGKSYYQLNKDKIKAYSLEYKKKTRNLL